MTDTNTSILIINSAGFTTCECIPGFYSEGNFTKDGCTTCPYAPRCLGGNSCAVGYAGRGCGGCAPNYYTMNEACVRCPESSAWQYSVLAAIAIAAVWWTFRLADLQQQNEVLSLLFMFTQETTLTVGTFCFS